MTSSETKDSYNISDMWGKPEYLHVIKSMNLTCYWEKDQEPSGNRYRIARSLDDRYKQLQQIQVQFQSTFCNRCGEHVLSSTVIHNNCTCNQ
jgi:hypothetical protein